MKRSMHRQAVWLYPEVKELLTTHMTAANALNRGGGFGSHHLGDPLKLA